MSVMQDQVSTWNDIPIELVSMLVFAIFIFAPIFRKRKEAEPIERRSTLRLYMFNENETKKRSLQLKKAAFCCMIANHYQRFFCCCCNLACCFWASSRRFMKLDFF